MTTATATNTAELGTAQDSKIVENMREGFKIGYMISLDHVEKMLEKRIGRKGDLINKAREHDLPQMEQRFTSMREEASIILDAVYNHKNRLEANFDFTDGGINDYKNN